MTDETIFIIGGGIAGLYCANILVERGFNVSVFEKQSKFGGRIKTVYDKKNPNSVCYESGPWRVHPSHKKFLSLIEKLGLHVIPTYHKVHYKKFPKERKRNMSNNNLSVKEMSLTLFQADCVEGELLQDVNLKMQKTGYDMLLQEPYQSNFKIIESEPDYFVVKEGLTKVIEKLLENLTKNDTKRVKLCTNHFVQDICYDKSSKLYNIKFTKRIQNQYIPFEKTARTIILGVPPSDLNKIPSLTLHPNINTVDSLPLLHTLAFSKNIPKNFGKYICNSPISQIIHSCYENNWFQISYTSGRLAMLFHNLIISSKKTWDNFIKKEFYKYFPSSIKIDKIVPHFWRHAVHYYHPNFGKTKSELSHRNIYPHPTKYQNLYIIGESISNEQAWIEGALDSVDHFIKIFRPSSTKKRKPRIKKPKEFVIYDGRILDVSKWKYVHPGSRQVIENHLGEDITNLWNQYHPYTASKYIVALEKRMNE
jgi:cytochrome b involved in lipid metabolism